MNKKEFTKIISTTIQNLNLTDTDLSKGREVAIGFVVGDIYMQQEILKQLKSPTEITYNKLKVQVSLFQKFKKNFIKIVSDDNGKV